MGCALMRAVLAWSERKPTRTASHNLFNDPPPPAPRASLSAHVRCSIIAFTLIRNSIFQFTCAIHHPWAIGLTSVLSSGSHARPGRDATQDARAMPRRPRRAATTYATSMYDTCTAANRDR